MVRRETYSHSIRAINFSFSTSRSLVGNRCYASGRFHHVGLGWQLDLDEQTLCLVVVVIQLCVSGHHVNPYSPALSVCPDNDRLGRRVVQI